MVLRLDSDRERASPLFGRPATFDFKPYYHLKKVPFRHLCTVEASAASIKVGKAPEVSVREARRVLELIARTVDDPAAQPWAWQVLEALVEKQP